MVRAALPSAVVFIFVSRLHRSKQFSVEVEVYNRRSEECDTFAVQRDVEMVVVEDIICRRS